MLLEASDMEEEEKEEEEEEEELRDHRGTQRRSDAAPLRWFWSSQGLGPSREVSSSLPGPFFQAWRVGTFSWSRWEEGRAFAGISGTEEQAALAF